VAITLYGNPVDPSGAKVSGVVHVALIDGGGAGYIPSVTEDTHVLSLWISGFDKDRADGVNGWSIPVTANDLITQPAGTYYYIREITPNGSGQTVKEFYVELSTARTTGEGSGPWEVGDPLLQVVPFVPPPFTPIAGPQGPVAVPTSDIMQAAVATYLEGVDLLQSSNFLSEFNADTDLVARSQVWVNLGIQFGSTAGTFVEGNDARLTGGGTGTPTGPAGGVLAGTYPNPSYAVAPASAAGLATEITNRTNADTTEVTNRNNAIDAAITTHAAATDPHADRAYTDTQVTVLKGGATAAGDTLGELEARLALIEAVGSLASDAELLAAITALIGTADTAGDTLGELEALINARLRASNNLSDVQNAATAAGNLLNGTILTTDGDFLVRTAGALARLGSTAVGRSLLSAADAPALRAITLAAPLASPTFTGVPAGPTAAQGTNTTQLATTAMVQSEVTLLAPKASPALTGIPTTPTAAQGTNTTQVASTAYVQTEVGLLVPKSVLTTDGDILTRAAGVVARITRASLAADTAFSTVYAPLASPTFTGVPAAPTAAPGTNTTQVATTAFVAALGALKANLAGPTFTGVPAAPTAAQGTNTTQLATTAMVHSEAVLLAPLASPALTGNPTAPTATAGDNDTSIATTAFVTGAISTASGLLIPASVLTTDGDLLTRAAGVPARITRASLAADTAFGANNIVSASTVAQGNVEADLSWLKANTVGTAAVGTAAGNLAVLGTGGKWPDSLLPSQVSGSGTTVNINNLATEQNLISFTLPAGLMASNGDLLIVEAGGDILANSGSPTFTWKFKNGTVTADSPADALTISASLRPWKLRAIIRRTTNSSSQAIELTLVIGNPGTTKMMGADKSYVGDITDFAATDFTTASTVVFTITMSVANANNRVRMYGYNAYRVAL
jgi:hypothetical protein